MTELMVRNEMSVMELGEVLARSGYFQDAKQAGQAVVKVLAGQELGLGPIASMTGINIIKGQVSPGASVMAAVIKRSKKYDYRVRELSEQKCDIVFYENGESIGSSSFTVQDAQKAGTGNMGKFPRNMLFARAISNGARWYTPDLFGGPIYEPGELGEQMDYENDSIVNEDIIEVEPAVEETESEPEEAVEPAPAEPVDEPARTAEAPEFPDLWANFAAMAVKQLGYRDISAVGKALKAGGITSVVGMDMKCAFNQADAWAILQDGK